VNTDERVSKTVTVQTVCCCSDVVIVLLEISVGLEGTLSNETAESSPQRIFKT
jgi:hypothetical protein